jgi:hypothetical protein
MQADKSLLDHMTDLMAEFATRAKKTAKDARASKAASVGGLFRFLTGAQCPSKFQIAASAAISGMHMIARRPTLFRYCTSDFPDTGARGFIDLGAVAPTFRRKLHDRAVDISIDHEKALVRFLRPFPPQIQGVFHRMILGSMPYIISSAVSLMAGIPSYFSASNP